MRAQSSAAPSWYSDAAESDEALQQAAAIGHAGAMPYLPEVESLRGIAMALVYSFHIDRFVSGNLPTDVSPVYAFVRAGHTGVSLFFVLSGFLLSLPFIDGVRHGRPIRPGRFYGRRALRIVPLYYTAVILGAVVWARQPADLLNALPYMLFLGSVPGCVTPMQHFSNVWWSLATEVEFYLLLPLLPLLLRYRAGRIALIAVLIAYGAAFVAFLRGDLYPQTIPGVYALRLSLFGQAPFFLFGIAVAAIYVRGGGRLRQGGRAGVPCSIPSRLAPLAWLRWGGGDAMLLVVIGCLALLLQWEVAVTLMASEQVPLFAWHLLEGLCWAGILALVVFLPLRSRWIWRSAALGHLGVISYSMYMWHIPIAKLGLTAFATLGIHGGAGWTITNAGIIMILTLICLGISELTYRYIERPFLRRKARLV